MSTFRNYLTDTNKREAKREAKLDARQTKWWRQYAPYAICWSHDLGSAVLLNRELEVIASYHYEHGSSYLPPLKSTPIPADPIEDGWALYTDDDPPWSNSTLRIRLLHVLADFLRGEDEEVVEKPLTPAAWRLEPRKP
jgi:hypothetical protein